MKRLIQKILLGIFLLAGLGLAAPSVRAAKQPAGISLNKTSVSYITGKKFRLTATVKPKAAAGEPVTWKSSNQKVATVDAAGKVTLVGVGTARITAQTADGKKAVCKVESLRYRFSGRRVQVSTPDGVMTYHAYSQKDYGYDYYRSFGCVTTATAIVASAYGKNYSPRDIHEGSAKKKYTERYAIAKMGETDAIRKWYGKRAISLRTASEILKNMGIENRPVYIFSQAGALAEIREHQKEGKPVLIKANNNRYNGLRLANVHHAIVLTGIDDKDRVIAINPNNPTYYTTITLKTLVYHHMTPASGSYRGPYVLDIKEGKSAGGYILVDGPKSGKASVSKKK